MTISVKGRAETRRAVVEALLLHSRPSSSGTHRAAAALRPVLSAASALPISKSQRKKAWKLSPYSSCMLAHLDLRRVERSPSVREPRPSKARCMMDLDAQTVIASSIAPVELPPSAYLRGAAAEARSCGKVQWGGLAVAAAEAYIMYRNSKDISATSRAVQRASYPAIVILPPSTYDMSAHTSATVILATGFAFAGDGVGAGAGAGAGGAEVSATSSLAFLLGAFSFFVAGALRFAGGMRAALTLAGALGLPR